MHTDSPGEAVFRSADRPSSGFCSDIDLFADDVLADPYPRYLELRDAAPAVYLTAHDVWFVGRYERVRAALTDWRTFTSAQGVGFNPILNAAWAQSELSADPPVHTHLRKLFTDRLGPRQLLPVTETIDARAEQLADELLERQTFDGVADLAHDLPVNVIMDLVGWPADNRDDLLAMAAGSFDSCGPEGERMRAALPTLERTNAYVAEMYERKNLVEGTFGHAIAKAAENGDISDDEAIGMLGGYVVAAFDTTINAIASGVWLFATHPEQWALLRSRPSQVTAALNEILRLESPIQHFSRVTTREVDMGEGVVIPAGARVMHSYAAANRDERHYGSDAQDFLIERNPTDHLAFGVGVHACAGQGLAKLEVLAVLRALATSVTTIELAGEPTLALNNITRGFAKLPVRVR